MDIPSRPGRVAGLTPSGPTAQNGQPIRKVSFRDMVEAGYVISYESPTVIGLEYKGHDLGFVVSALPTISLADKTIDKAAGG